MQITLTKEQLAQALKEDDGYDAVLEFVREEYYVNDFIADLISECDDIYYIIDLLSTNKVLAKFKEAIEVYEEEN